MIKFFRRIRQNLITENKFSKYILYAVGEIILVVIGILIALSLNNWKENLANRGEEMRILSGLKQEFEINLAEVRRNIKLNTLTKESTVDLIHLIRTEKPFANSRYLDSILNAVYMFGSFDAQTGLVDEVIGSGKLSVIKDIELRDRLTGISGLLDNLEEDYVIRSNYYMDNIIPFLSKYIALANQDQFMDFSSWSDTYKTIELTESPFKQKYDEIDLLLFENLIATHKLNNDFVTLDESDLRDFFIETLKIINTNLESDKQN
ncbi:hypothetical protein OE09_1036 [Flavobacteriaceae bacterium MAR_2010_72]|nr:hypothetical protein OE09_1036 [Flavobacteriaceae bacterium MAR_2010_72]TVZ60162.1 hypothetical protein NA63_2712 [Flavobacteriaceae bacterium MAR_2010_105]